MWSIVFRAKSILSAGEQFAKPTTKSIMNASHILNKSNQTITFIIRSWKRRGVLRSGEKVKDIRQASFCQRGLGPKKKIVRRQQGSSKKGKDFQRDEIGFNCPRSIDVCRSSLYYKPMAQQLIREIVSEFQDFDCECNPV